jgi:lipopolysaccharide/colanic/teichoic acid biosynthesis glycosyltransferase
MATQLILFLTNIILINAAFLLSFSIRYGLPFPEFNFAPFKKTFVFLTLIYVSALFFFKVHKSRFRSSWELFRKVLSGLCAGTLLSVAFVYVFRQRWGAFPTSVFVLSFFVNLILIFKVNQTILKLKGKIKRNIVVIGKGGVDEIIDRKTVVERIGTDEIEKLAAYTDIDEIVICERIENKKDLNFLLYLVQKSKIDVVFSPALYMELLPEHINGHGTVGFLSTFVGEKRDVEEFLIRALDIFGSFVILLMLLPIIVLFTLLVKFTSQGPVFYKQQRVGKDGRLFTLHKFRTMTKDAEKTVGPVLASRNDPRVTKVGRILRTTRLDELPQLYNVLRGDMSLVGPRPERPYFVKLHKVLQELRLAVKPGITGLAQIRSLYDTKPNHKIKYDYLYIQKRSLLLNLYILAKTIPLIFSKKGW